MYCISSNKIFQYFFNFQKSCHSKKIKLIQGEKQFLYLFKKKNSLLKNYKFNNIKWIKILYKINGTNNNIIFPNITINNNFIMHI